MPLESRYIACILLSSALALAIAYWLWDDDAETDGRLFFGLMLLHPIVGGLVIAELLAPSRSLATVLYGLHSSATVLVILLWFLFALAYTDRHHWFERPRLAIIVGGFAAVALLEATNPVHGIVWSGYRVVETPFPYVSGIPTAVFQARGAVLTLVNLAAMGMLAGRFLFGARASRIQTVALFVGFLPPWIVYGAWVTGVLPGPLNGGFVIGSAWSFAVVSGAVYRYKLFDLVPLARKRVFEGLDDATIVVDADRRLLDYNQSALELCPELAGAGGRALDDVAPGLVDDSGEEPFVEELTVYGEGDPEEYAVSTSPIAVGNEVHGYGLVLRDVTERQRHVRDLEQQTEQLERFASTLSHDLRNPLNVAQGRVQIAIERESTDGLSKAVEAHERIEAMIEDLLTLAREGRTIDETEPVRLADVFRDAWETTDTRAGTSVVVPDADVVIYADADRLQHVFENLFRNAIEHGGDDVTVTLGRHPGGFFVADDGPGVPPEDRDEVFEFGYTTSQGGTGLGLAIVESIARAHGWTVELREGSNGGARFDFSDVDAVDAVTESTASESVPTA